MRLFRWRHSKEFSSWSMLDEPHICASTQNYMRAEVLVLAASLEEALALLARDGNWQVEELRRVESEVIPLDTPRIIAAHVDGQILFS